MCKRFCGVISESACVFQFDTPGEGYIFRQNLVLLALPVFCIAIGLLHLSFSCLVSSMAMKGNQFAAMLHLVRSVPLEVANACVTAFSTMYIMLISTAVEAWHCSTRMKAESHLDSDPQANPVKTPRNDLLIFISISSSSRTAVLFRRTVDGLRLALRGIYWNTLGLADPVQL